VRALPVRLLKGFLQIIFFFYKKVVSPVLEFLFGHACRYTPTCSEYMAQAVEKFGILYGVLLGVKRFLKCNPFFEGGYDPLPKK